MIPVALSPTIKPTRAELVILNVLWKHGPGTVRAIHENMPATSVCGYTTVLKLLQIMHGKGLVMRDVSRRAHVYRPASGKSAVQAQLTFDLIQQVYDGSPVQLIVQMLELMATAKAKDIDRIRQMLNRVEHRQLGE